MYNHRIHTTFDVESCLIRTCDQSHDVNTARWGVWVGWVGCWGGEREVHFLEWLSPKAVYLVSVYTAVRADIVLPII